MVDVVKWNGLTAPIGTITFPTIEDITTYTESATTHSAGTIPTWTTRVSHTLSDSSAYISLLWNTGTGTSYTQSFYYKIILNGTTVEDSYVDLGTTLGRCWPEPYASNEQWMIVGVDAWTMHTHPMWCDGTIQIQTSPSTASTTHYLNLECHIMDVDMV